MVAKSTFFGALLVGALLIGGCGTAETEPAADETSAVPAAADQTAPAADSTSTAPATSEPAASADSTAPPETTEPAATQPGTGEPATDDTIVSTTPPTVAKPTVTTGVPVTTLPFDSIPAGMASIVADAVADLSSRLGVGEAAIGLVEADYHTRPDSSIGCPQPGMSYTQVLVDGARVVLASGGVEYHYHKGGLDPVFYCATA